MHSHSILFQFQVCYHCKKKGASIGCWIRNCRRSFHFPCAIEIGCSYEFIDDYRCYCDVHFGTHGLNTCETHEPDVLCAICALPMGDFDKTKSIMPICCAEWCHKNCLKQMAFHLNDDFDCPNCDNKNEFRENVLYNGIYIPSADYLPACNTDSNGATQQTKRKRVSKDWILEKTFATRQAAMDAIESEKCWGYHYDNKSDAGRKVTYRCNLVKARGQQCSAAIYLLYDATNTSVHLYRADSAHTHDDEICQNNVVTKISGILEAEIRSMFELGMKTKPILFNLTMKGLTAPPKAQLTTFLTKLRNEKFGAAKLHFGSLEQWLKECNEVPENENQPFVVSYNVKVDDSKPDNSTFRFFVSTKTLIKNAINVINMHTDATYKLVWQGYPVLLAGLSDSNRKFHPFGVCVATRECADDFEFMFKSLKTAVKDLFDVDIDPQVLICDAAASIHNGFSKVFPSHAKDIVMCWSHMRRNVVKKLPQYISDQKAQNYFMCK